MPNKSSRAQIDWFFRNVPVVTLLLLIGTFIWVTIAFSAESAMGIVLIVYGTLGYLYLIVRYALISYRVYKRRNSPKSSILIVLDLKIAEWICLAAIVTGLYMIDETDDKTRFISHPSFGAGTNLYQVWLYILTSAIAALTLVGLTSVVEAHIATAVVYAFGVMVSFFSAWIVLQRIITEESKHIVLKHRQKTTRR